MENPHLPSDLSKIINGYLAPQVEYVDETLGKYEAGLHQVSAAIEVEIKEDQQNMLLMAQLVRLAQLVQLVQLVSLDQVLFLGIKERRGEPQWLAR
jgi:hypothetical protein